MGLDLIVEGCARPGYEAEWRQILERSFRGEEPVAGEVERFGEVSIPPHERVGAPRVGYDEAADEWIIKASGAATPNEIARAIQDHRGYYVLRLVECDGIPIYSHGGLYEGVDETSFRGAFLSDCGDVLPRGLIEQAWDHKLPEDAVSYGHALLAAAARVKAAGARLPEPKRGLLSRFRREPKSSTSIPLDEQLDIVGAAGRWFLFWGKRGHAIRAWF